MKYFKSFTLIANIYALLNPSSPLFGPSSILYSKGHAELISSCKEEVKSLLLAKGARSRSTPAAKWENYKENRLEYKVKIFCQEPHSFQSPSLQAPTWYSWATSSMRNVW